MMMDLEEGVHFVIQRPTTVSNVAPVSFSSNSTPADAVASSSHSTPADAVASSSSSTPADAVSSLNSTPADTVASSSSSTPADAVASSLSSTPAVADVSCTTPADIDANILINKSRKSDADKRMLHREYTETAKVIKESLRKLPPIYHCEYLAKSLEKAGASNIVPTTSRNSKARGIHRTADYVINLVWEYWKSEATVSNARTSRPATTPVTTSETDPLLSCVDTSNEQFVTHTTQRGHTRFEHPYMVQNATDLEIFEKFKSKHTLTIGQSTFRKLKPFFVRKCKEKDIETCCCIYHVNFRNGFDALSTSFKDCKFPTSEVVEQVTNIIKSYDSYKSYIFQFCKRDDYNILCYDCESGNCGHWTKLFDDLVTKISGIVKQNKVTKKFIFTRFVYMKTEEYGTKLQPDTTPLSLEDICSFNRSKLVTFVKHSNTHFRDCILWKVLKPYTKVNGSALIVIDFSENLSIPVQKEPQSMYWVRKQVSIMCGISEASEKTYYGHFSESRLHDQYVQSSFHLQNKLKGY